MWKSPIGFGDLTDVARQRIATVTNDSAVWINRADRSFRQVDNYAPGGGNRDLQWGRDPQLHRPPEVGRHRKIDAAPADPGGLQLGHPLG